MTILHKHKDETKTEVSILDRKPIDTLTPEEIARLDAQHVG